MSDIIKKPKHTGDDILCFGLRAITCPEVLATWPDLTSCHYARQTQNWLANQNVAFVSRNDNSLNLPHVQPIEDCCALLSQKAYKGGWEAQNEEELRRRI